MIPFAIWSSKLESKEELFEAVRLYCSLTHSNELVIEGCYLYCYTIQLLFSCNYSMKEAYDKMFEESERRAKVSGCIAIKYWILDDIEVEGELRPPHYIPIDYIKIPLCWAFYYLKNEY